jgi:hypothetical protein
MINNLVHTNGSLKSTKSFHLLMHCTRDLGRKRYGTAGVTELHPQLGSPEMGRGGQQLSHFGAAHMGSEDSQATSAA